MPPKYKFTKEQIVDSALQITRKEGIDGVTARRVAGALHASPKVIFSLFEGMEQLQEQVIKAAVAHYNGFTDAAMKEQRYPPYKAMGMAYIRYAREERELFRLLFMRGSSRCPETLQINGHAIAVLMENYRISEEQAGKLQLQMWFFSHGIATLLATDYLPMEEELISEMLTDQFTAMIRKYQEDNLCQ